MLCIIGNFNYNTFLSFIKVFKEMEEQYLYLTYTHVLI